MANNDKYDVVIIGSGPGGYVAGIRAGQLGLKVAVVEKDPFLGGTCLHRGCIPTKSLLENAYVYKKIQHSKDFGIQVGDVNLDFSQVQTRKQGVVDQNAKGIEFLFKKNKVERITGFGSLAGKGVVEVSGDGEDRKLETKNVILAMGSVPKDLPHIKADGKKILNSDHILEIDRVPKSMLVIGAGAVGCEFASIFNDFGTDVTLVEVLPRLLPIEDADISKEFGRLFKKRGINTMTDVKVQSCEPTDEGVKTVVEMKKGKTKEIETEIVLMSVGRRGVLEGVKLEETKVEIENGFVQVDEMMRTAEPHVYAIGDIVPTPALAHCASAEGIVAVEHIAGLDSVRPINYAHIPNATYSDPEVASVGLTEEQAKEKGYDVTIGKFPFTANSKSKIIGDAGGVVKYVSEAKYDELLGVHIVGPKATELIAEACAALELEATSESIAKTIHAHPTLSEAMMEAAEDVTGHSIHQ
ncbi:MAG: dihydrolipoyl dehydrogenase [Thermoanaerobaculia bacterium]|nr:dihydrolipoyl dehydrogenase [Thermoanaerobaculia bacterium]